VGREIADFVQVAVNLKSVGTFSPKSGFLTPAANVGILCKHNHTSLNNQDFSIIRHTFNSTGQGSVGQEYRRQQFDATWRLKPCGVVEALKTTQIQIVTSASTEANQRSAQ
jgi:hypothetical protein